MADDNIITIIVRSSALNSIENDPNFSKHLVNAIKSNKMTNNPVDVQAGSHIQAATVVEQHPNEVIKLLTIGYGYGSVLCDTEIGFEHHTTESKIAIIKDVVFRLGYFLKKRAKRWNLNKIESVLNG